MIEWSLFCLALIACFVAIVIFEAVSAGRASRRRERMNEEYRKTYTDRK